MNITVNNQKVKIQYRMKLRDYLEMESLNESKGIAVAVNECVIAKNDWDTLELIDNDNILIIHATQGG